MEGLSSRKGKENSERLNSRGQRDICRDFARRGSCVRGQKCRFAHGSSDSRSQPRNEGRNDGRIGGRSDSRDTSEASRVFRMLSNRDPQHWSEDQTRVFINSAYEVCQTDSASLLNVFVEKEDENGNVGIRLLRALLSNKKITSSSLASSPGQVSLEEVLVPFLRVVTAGRILNSTMQPLVNPFIQMISDAIDWKSLTNVLEAMAAKTTISFQQAGSSDEIWMAKNMSELLLPIVVFCCEMLQRFDLDKLDEGKEMLGVLKKFKLSEAHAETSKLTTQLMELEGLVQAKLNPLEMGKIVAELREKQKEEARKQKVNSAPPKALVQSSDLPGHLCKEGRPRHDNDFPDINRISVAPTGDEILCEKPPYLPQNRAGSVRHLPQGSKRAHRDLHFRLLRHDLLADVTNAIQLLRKGGGIRGLDSNSTFKTESTVLRAYRNVEFCGVELDHHTGVTYRIKFDQLNSLKKKNPSDRLQVWGKNRLAQGTLVCFYDEGNGGGPARPNIMFGVVTERKPHNLTKDKPTICIRLTAAAVHDKVWKCALGLKSYSNTEIVMLQAGATFFAYEHILTALKTCHIPLDQYIVAPPGNSCMGGRRNVEVPAYLRRARARFDLSFLASPGASPGDRHYLRSVDLTAPERFPLDVISRATTLDRPQAEAIKAGLTKELALIQGPPGTGKTYVGVQIVRCLLKNQSKVKTPARPGPTNATDTGFGPILCVCYTNHALDSFLMDLIESGVEGIVRVGGNSKQEALQAYNLRELKRTEGTVTPGQRQMKTQWWKELDELQQDAEECAERISSEQNLKWHNVAVAIKTDNIMFSKSLLKVGGKGLSLEKAWEKWSKGGPRDLYKSIIDYHRTVNSMQDEGLADTGNQFEALDENNRKNNKKNQQGKTIESRIDEALFQSHGIRMQDIKAMEKQNRPFTELRKTQNIWQMSKHERKRLIRHWRGMLFDEESETFRRAVSAYQSVSKKMKAINEDISLSVLRKAKIVGMTTSGVAQQQHLIGALESKIVIVEEAAEVLEAHILTSLSSSTEHLILIGDHEQLRPKPQVYELQEDSRAGYNLDVSLFERLITQGSLPYTTLETQRRMRPQISRLIRDTIYPNLKDHQVVTQYPARVKGVGKTMLFLDHDHPENGDKEGTSKSNDFEAHFAVKLAKYLAQQRCYVDGEIAIITPYVGQLLKIRKAMSESNIKVVLGSKDQDLLEQFLEGKQEENDVPSNDSPAAAQVSLRECIRAATVDNFQGEEAKVVILSLTRNNKGGHIGFLGNRNRANVMLSRAKHGMYILGNKQSMKACKKKGTIWPAVIDIMEAQGCLGKAIKLKCEIHPENCTNIDDWNDFDKLVGDGGCQERCATQLPCGHICPRRCHTDDRNHQVYKCMRMVPVMLPCGHFIKAIHCYRAQDKGSIQCQEMVSVVPPNCPDNHERQMTCWESRNNEASNCTHKIDLTLPFCGHKMNIPCWKRDSIKRTDCKQKCGMQIEGCSHACGNACGGCTKLTEESGGAMGDTRDEGPMVHKPCTQVCDRSLLCGHACKSKCHKGECPPCEEKCEIKCMHKQGGCGKTCTDPCVPCAEDCMWECVHQGKCTLPCGGPCDRLPCDKRCNKILECECRCPCLCGEPCPSSNFCLTHAPEIVQNQVVDQIMLTSFRDLSDEDLEDDPLVVLECGHVATKSTMDGWMGLHAAYEADQTTGEWLRPRPLAPEIEKMKVCFTCRVPIRGLFRYGRCVNKLSLDSMELKFLKRCDVDLGHAHDLLQKAMEEIENSNNPSQRRKLQTMAVHAQNKFIGVTQKAKRPPKLAVYEKMKATILAQGGGQEQIDASGCPKPDFTRSCKGAIGVVSSGNLWLHSQTLHVRQITLPSVALGDDAEFEQMSERVNKYAEEARDLAIATKSLTLELKLYMSWVEFLWRMTQHLGAKARTPARSQRTEKILEQAKELVEIGSRKSTSTEQRNHFERLRKMIDKPARGLVLDMLAVVIQHDNTLRHNSGDGHIYTCPNGHIYVIGHCGQAMQTSRCPDCGETIGGQSHELTASNVRDQGIAQEIANRRH